MSAAATVTSLRAEEPQTVTLLELVRTLSEITDDDREVVATVLHLLRSGQVRLCGNFRDAPIQVFES
ncbi:MAG: hypothetical protein MJE66_17875 [Proteobacteria bacterium]|nr:hypothetical protein [Pseudomonadota bacterium]